MFQETLHDEVDKRSGSAQYKDYVHTTERFVKDEYDKYSTPLEYVSGTWDHLSAGGILSMYIRGPR